MRYEIIRGVIGISMIAGSLGYVEAMQRPRPVVPTLPCGEQGTESDQTYKKRCPDGSEVGMADIEKQIPPNNFCMKDDVYAYNEAHGRHLEQAHPCSCKIVCETNEDGTQEETSNANQPGCLTDCHKNGRSCTCHVEEPCPGSHPGANAMMDMDHHVVAVLR